MQFVNQTQSSSQTPYSILANIYESKRSTTANVVAPKQPQTPWYAKVKPQNAPLTKATQKALGFNPDDVKQTSIIENAGWWKQFLIWGMTTGFLNKHDAEELIEAKVGTVGQIKAAESVSSRVLSAYGKHISEYEQAVKNSVESYGATEGVVEHIERWYRDESLSTWSMALTIDDSNSYGEDYDELDRSFNGMGIRLETDCRVASLAFDLDSMTPDLAKIYYQAISLLSEMSYKSNLLDSCMAWGDTEETANVLLSSNITIEQAEEISLCDEDDMPALLDAVDPSMADKFSAYTDMDDIRRAAMALLATSLRPWYDKYQYHNTTAKDACEDMLKKLKKVRPNPLREDDNKAIKTLEAVLKTVAEKAHEIDREECPWLLGSDTPVTEFCFVHFYSEHEEMQLEIENEHRQCVGEHGAMRLDLTSGKTGFETIENILLGEHCLMLLASHS